MIPTYLIQHLIAFVQHEGLDAAQPQRLLSDERVQTPRSGDDDVRMRLFVLEHLHVLLDRGAPVEDRRLDLGEVLAEARTLVLDLIGQLAGVAHDQDRRFAGDGLKLLEGGEDKDGRFPEARLRLA